MSEVGVALADAVAVVQEFSGAPIEDVLGAFGLEARDVADVLEERLMAYGHLDGAERTAFVTAFCQGLLSGIKVRTCGAQ